MYLIQYDRRYRCSAGSRASAIAAVASPGMGHWGTGHVLPPWSLMHAKFCSRFFVSTYRPITHIKALITVTVAGCCKKTLVIFVFAVLTPDGFHFWMTLSPRTSEPVRHASVPPPPLEQNSGDATALPPASDVILQWSR